MFTGYERMLVCCLALMCLLWAGRAEAAESYEILFIGNSHSSANDLPVMVSRLIESGMVGAQAEADLAPGWGFLADRIGDGVTRPALESRPWSHVILQAQKYSTSGAFFYPTDAAEEWIRRARNQGAAPILFPEWPRRGNREEGSRVHQLHLSIAAREPACVAPVGMAWERTIDRHPDIDLYAADGNHANRTGSLLTAFVLYEVITGQQATALPYVKEIRINAANQGILAQMASETVAMHTETCDQGSSEVLSRAYRGIPSLGGWGLVMLGIAVSAGAIWFGRPGQSS